MALDEQGQNRRTVMVGGDPVVIGKTPAGLVAVNMPARREAVGTRTELRKLRDALDAVLSGEGGE